MTFVGSPAKENFEDAKNKQQGFWIFTNSLGRYKVGIPNSILTWIEKSDGSLDKACVHTHSLCLCCTFKKNLSEMTCILKQQAVDDNENKGHGELEGQNGQRALFQLGWLQDDVTTRRCESAKLGFNPHLCSVASS